MGSCRRSRAWAVLLFLMRIAGILLCQECTHQRRNLVNILVEREVPGVQDMHLRFWDIALVGKHAANREGFHAPQTTGIGGWCWHNRSNRTVSLCVGRGRHARDRHTVPVHRDVVFRAFDVVFRAFLAAAGRLGPGQVARWPASCATACLRAGTGAGWPTPARSACRVSWRWLGRRLTALDHRRHQVQNPGVQSCLQSPQIPGVGINMASQKPDSSTQGSYGNCVLRLTENLV